MSGSVVVLQACWNLLASEGQWLQVCFRQKKNAAQSLNDFKFVQRQAQV